MHKYLLFLCVSSSFLFGCSINAPPYNVSIKGANPEIAVIYFDDTHAPNNYDGPIEFGKLFAEYVAGALQELSYNAVALEHEEAASGYNYLIRGSIITIEQGNWNKRFWIGFGAGKAMIAAKATLIRTSDGKEIESHKGHSSSLTFQGRNNILRRASANLARSLIQSFSRTLANQ